MKPICTALVATVALTPAASAAPVDLIATFDVNTFSFAPEETVQQALDFTNGQNNNPFDNDFSGGFMSPQTGTGPDDTDYIDDAAERELQEETFVDGLPYGGAQWNGENNSGTPVPVYTPGVDDPYGGNDFINKWVLPEDVWEFDEITARFVLDSDDFGLENVSGNINEDVVGENFSLLDSSINTLFETDTLGSLFTTNSGEGALVQTTAAVALDSTNATDGDGNLLQENDILVIAGIEEGESGPLSIGLYATVFVGDTNWFETVFSDEGENNLLASLENEDYGLESQFILEDRRWGFDEVNGFVPLGTFEIEGALTSLITETSGASEQSALLPDAEPSEDGAFTFEVAIEQLINDEGIVWIDPDIATGYVYQATQTINDVEQNAVFTAVQAPGLEFVDEGLSPGDEGYGYTLTVTHIVDDNGNLIELPYDPNDDTRPTYSIEPGEIVTFNQRVGIFELTGISEDLMLDPENGLLFQTGLGFENTSGLFNISQTPITTFIPDDNQLAPVPLPMPALMLLTGIGGLAVLRRRRKSA